MPATDEPLTERQRYWREHLSRCEAAGQTVRAYAAENKLSAFALYDTRRTMKRVRRSSSAVVKSTSASASPRFVRVTATAPTTMPCRAHLRNGVVLEIGVAASDLGVVLRDLAALA